MTKLTGSLAGLDWRGRAVMAFLAGLLSMLAMPPFLGWTVLFVTLPILVLLLDSAAQQRRRVVAAALVGWCFGFGYFLAGFYWVYHAFLVEGDRFGWLIPIVVPLLPAILALFYGVVAVLVIFFWSAGAARIVALALSFTVVEWIRGHVFTGFPWHSLGYALTSTDGLMQSASLFGLYGLTFVVVIVFASPVLLLRNDMTLPGDFRRYCSGIEGRFFLGAMGLFLALLVWGNLRIWHETEYNDAVAIRIIQPNIVQKDKWDFSKRTEIIAQFVSLTRQAVTRKVDVGDGVTGAGQAKTRKILVIWPESSMPFFLARERPFLDGIADILPPDSYLLTGNIRAGEAGAKTVGGSKRRPVFNSLLLFGSGGELKGFFDKKHLIPFGEYMPLRSLFALVGLRQLANANGAFSVGTRQRFLEVDGIPPLAPLLCYEVIFPDEVLEGSKRPEWLLNVTNDAWYGRSDGPRQHFHYARVRSVEQGLPMVRAANTGISAIIDAYGRVVKRLPLGQEGVVRGNLPKKISATLYARYGGWILLFILGFGILLYKITRN